MHAETLSVTVLTVDELKDLFRGPLKQCGIEVEDIRFPTMHNQVIRVASNYNFDSENSFTLEACILDALGSKFQGAYLAYPIVVAELLATLVSFGLAPKTDYLITGA